MRFASLGGSNAGNYAGAGKAVADSAANIFDVQRKTGPDYARLSATAMATQSAEKVAAMKAEAQMAKAGVNAYNKAFQSSVDVKGYNKIQDLKQKQRKAGGIAALGKIAGAAFLATRNDKRELPTNSAEKKAFLAKQKAGIQSLIEQQDALDKQGLAAGDKLISGNGGSSSTTANTGGDAGKVSTGGSSGTGKSAPGDISMRYMKLLTDNGMSDVQAAATVGHLQVESDNFQADTEYAPNAYGTRGRGHLQWTDTGNSGGRRSNFEAFAASKGLSPTSFEANSQFLLSEMSGNHGNHWTGGGSLKAFKGLTDLNTASAYLQSKYIRPGIPHTQRRLDAGNQALQQWRAQQGG